MKFTNLPRSTILAAGGAFFIGTIGIWEASNYPFGSLRQIGPAIFPVSLSILLLLAGAGIILEQLVSGKSDAEDPKAAKMIVILSVLGGPIAFALLINRFGLVPAIFAGVLISSIAERKLSIWKLLLLSAALSAGCTLVFVWLLKLPLRPFIW